MVKHKHILSLGFFCSVASELKRFGLLRKSYPFDWLISHPAATIDLISDHFSFFLDPDYLVIDEVYPYIIHNTKYKVDFYHDFEIGQPITKDLINIQTKYRRRIKRFYSALNEGSLCVRYMIDQKECDFWENNFEKLVSLLRTFNVNNDVILIANNDVISDKLPIYFVEKDKGQSIALFFINKNINLFIKLIFFNLNIKGKIKAFLTYLKYSYKLSKTT